jgi:hypothetical protein
VKSAQNQRCGVLCDVPQYTRPRNSAGAMPCGVRAGSAWPGCNSSLVMNESRLNHAATLQTRKPPLPGAM